MNRIGRSPAPGERVRCGKCRNVILSGEPAVEAEFARDSASGRSGRNEKARDVARATGGFVKVAAAGAVGLSALQSADAASQLASAAGEVAAAQTTMASAAVDMATQSDGEMVAEFAGEIILGIIEGILS